MADYTPGHDPLDDRLRKTFTAEHADIERRRLAKTTVPPKKRSSTNWMPLGIAAALLAIAGFAFFGNRGSDTAIDLGVAEQPDQPGVGINLEGDDGGGSTAATTGDGEAQTPDAVASPSPTPTPAPDEMEYPTPTPVPAGGTNLDTCPGVQLSRDPAFVWGIGLDDPDGGLVAHTDAAIEAPITRVLPPKTGRLPLNPEGAWAMDAQLETELFGLINPGRPADARAQARFFAQVTSSGPAVDASAFYAHLYSIAFGSSDISALIAHARASEPDESIVAPIVDDVVRWHNDEPSDWRATRAKIKQAYDTDPEWWASRVNFATTIMALLYGDGDLRRTINIAGLAGWDADNNMTTSAGLLGITVGFDDLPEPFASSTDIYFNEDLSGDLPQFDTVTNIAMRTADLGLAGG